jgi:predicted NAD/FAD-dependent oxidoreductase
LAEEVIAAESDASAVALKAANILLPEFTATLKEMGIDVPTVVHCKGHRWSASFPVPSLSEEMLDSALGSRKVSLGDDTAMGRGFVNHDKKFAACGDWIAPLGKAGCAEVAVLSGLAVGRALANLQ